MQRADKCDSYQYYCSILKSGPFVFAHNHAPCQDSNKCSSMPPKIQDCAYSSLASLSPRTRSRRGKQSERRARGVEADPRRERSNKKKNLELLKCRESDSEADTVKKLLPTHGLGFVIYHFIYISNSIGKIDGNNRLLQQASHESPRGC